MFDFFKFSLLLFKAGTLTFILGLLLLSLEFRTFI